MAQTTTPVTICNRGLQLLGAKQISSLNENNREARAMNAAYQPVLLSELRKRIWRFSIVRAQLPAAARQPLFGPANYYPIPGDFLMLAPADTQSVVTSIGSAGAFPGASVGAFGGRDWQIESMGNGVNAIVTSDTSPINVRYVSSAITEAQFDVAFAEAFAAALAMNTCEAITQSNTKYANAKVFYKEQIDSAAQRNMFEMQPIQPPTDPWLLARR